MKNKLLLTTALISGLSVIGSASFAETKITGEIKTGYKSGDALGTTAGGRSGFFRESQLNLTKTGTLNNGLNYVAGFSFESDGNDTAGVTTNTAKNIVTSDEGFFIEIGSGNSSVQMGLDKAPNIDQSATPRVAENTATAVGSYAGATYTQSGGQITQAFGVAAIQKTPFGQFAVNYVPDMSSQGTGDTTVQGAGENGNVGYEFTFRGKPISAAPGLDVFVGRSTQVDKNAIVAGGSSDQVVTVYSAGYNFGKFAAGFDRRNQDDYGANGTDRKQTEISATAALSDNVSIGIGKIDIDISNQTLDEEITYLQVGYNMGAIFSSFGMFDVENGGGTATNEGKLYSARLGVKF